MISGQICLKIISLTSFVQSFFIADVLCSTIKNEHKCEKIIVLVDTDGPKEEKEKLVKRNLSSVLKNHNIEIAYANICIESWILGCFENIKNPENFPSCQEAKKELRNREKKRTLKSIIQKNEIKHFEKSESFRMFKDKLTALVA